MGQEAARARVKREEASLQFLLSGMGEMGQAGSGPASLNEPSGSEAPRLFPVGSPGPGVTRTGKVALSV